MTQINDPKLKPCPFCGEDAAIWYNPASERLNRQESYYVACTNDNCGCELEHQGGWKTYEDAVNAWNHRSSHSENLNNSTTKNDLGVASELEKNSKKLEKNFGELDCISRADAQTEIEMNASRYTIAKERGGMGQVEWSDQLIKVSDAVDIIRHLPSVTPQERKGEWLRMSDLSEQEDDRYKCSRCGNVIHHKNEMDLYTFNSWCGRCGSDNGRHINYEVEV